MKLDAWHLNVASRSARGKSALVTQALSPRRMQPNRVGRAWPRWGPRFRRHFLLVHADQALDVDLGGEQPLVDGFVAAQVGLVQCLRHEADLLDLAVPAYLVAGVVVPDLIGVSLALNTLVCCLAHLSLCSRLAAFRGLAPAVLPVSCSCENLQANILPTKR